jgi:hypothetical protein
LYYRSWPTLIENKLTEPFIALIVCSNIIAKIYNVSNIRITEYFSRYNEHPVYEALIVKSLKGVFTRRNLATILAPKYHEAAVTGL